MIASVSSMAMPTLLMRLLARLFPSWRAELRAQNARIERTETIRHRAIRARIYAEAVRGAYRLAGRHYR